MLLCTVEGAISGACTCQKLCVDSGMKCHHTQLCCQDLLAGGSLSDTNGDKPVLPHLSKARGPIQYPLQPWHGKQSCKLPIFACFKLLFKNVTETGELEGGGDVSRAENKSSISPQLFQSRCLRTFKGETKSCLMQSSHRSCSCEQSDQSLQVPS